MHRLSTAYVPRTLKRFLPRNSGGRVSRGDSLDLSLKSETMDSCYACTRKEVPHFHSISCGQDHPLFREVYAGSSLYPVQSQISIRRSLRKHRQWICGSVQDPRSRFIQRMNRCFLLARSVSLAVDPLFFYILAVSAEQSCIYLDGVFAIVVTVLRTASDLVHLLHMWLQFKLAYISKESLVLGRGSLEWDAHKVFLHYLHQSGGFWFDLFVILPVPQVVFWVVVPNMIRSSNVSSVMTVFLMTFLFQYIPKLCHVVVLARRLRHVSGYIFGTLWWGFAMNLTAYFIAAHVAGGCWYLLASQRVATCLESQCTELTGCNARFLGCSPPILYKGHIAAESSQAGSFNGTDLSLCFTGQSNQITNYGIFQWAIPLVTGHVWATKVFYPIFWGVMTLSSFGNALTPSDYIVEVVFSIIVITCGLLLFTLLIGNIQVLLQSLTARKEAMKLRIRVLEWWMRRRQLPACLRHRVRRYERHLWASTRGIDEMGIVSGLPEGLRRDIKKHLCLNLVRQVPLFEQLDSLVLENICDRLKPHLFIKGEMVIRQGDPVQRMLFIVRGHMHSGHELSNGKTSICYLGPENFCGDELLTWCLKRPFVDRLPPATATLTSVDSIEAFGLDAQDLKFVTEHFRYKFVNDKMKRTARYYSSGWRTWAVVTMQLAWRRYKARKAKFSSDEPAEFLNAASARISPLPRSESERDRLRFYAALFTSPKPQDHLE